MTLRKADMRDAGAICRISRDDLGYDCTDEFVASRLAGLDDRCEAVFVAEIDGVVAGYIHAQVYTLLYFEQMVNILGLAVSSDYRRRGVGGALLHCAEDWARQNGIRIMRLNSGGGRTEAHEFYRAMGYNDEKTQIRFLRELD